MPLEKSIKGDHERMTEDPHYRIPFGNQVLNHLMFVIKKGLIKKSEREVCTGFLLIAIEMKCTILLLIAVAEEAVKQNLPKEYEFIKCLPDIGISCLSAE